MTTHTKDQGQIIAAIWGTAAVDKTTKTLTEDGLLEPTANPFAKQLDTDVKRYLTVEAAHDFLDEWRLRGDSGRALFEEGPVQQAFCKMDTAAFRWHYLAGGTVDLADEEAKKTRTSRRTSHWFVDLKTRRGKLARQLSAAARR